MTTGVAVQSTRLTLDLRRSRNRVVAAREKERRRILHDLHDGLGPALAAIALQLQAASRMAHQDSTVVAVKLDQLAVQLRESIADVGQIVEGLRPPMLDQLGLVGALEEQASRFASGAPGGDLSGGFNVSVSTEGDLKTLPAAVEVAAFRIASEALNNVYKHAAARNCTVRMCRNSALELRVIDDGVGISEDRCPGVGLDSMCERAEELGGSLVVEARPEGGTAVSARLPLPKS